MKIQANWEPTEHGPAVCLSVCPSARLPACLSLCLCVCGFVCLFVCACVFKGAPSKETPHFSPPPPPHFDTYPDFGPSTPARLQLFHFSLGSARLSEAKRRSCGCLLFDLLYFFLGQGIQTEHWTWIFSEGRRAKQQVKGQTVHVKSQGVPDVQLEHVGAVLFVVPLVDFERSIIRDILENG